MLPSRQGGTGTRQKAEEVQRVAKGHVMLAHVTAPRTQRITILKNNVCASVNNSRAPFTVMQEVLIGFVHHQPGVVFLAELRNLNYGLSRANRSCRVSCSRWNCGGNAGGNKRTPIRFGLRRCDDVAVSLLHLMARATHMSSRTAS